MHVHLLAMRIPLSSASNRRLEHRVAGADANPYFVVAAILAGIHHGISNATEPRPMTPERARLEYEISVPLRWPLALDAFDAGKFLPGYFGKDYHELFSQCRREEESNYHAQIPAQDFDWLLRSV
jgi:glutamine synthetase